MEAFFWGLASMDTEAELGRACESQSLDKGHGARFVMIMEGRALGLGFRDWKRKRAAGLAVSGLRVSEGERS